MQLVEQAVKLTTTASGQYAGAKRQIGDALCVLLLEKKQWIGKNTTSKKSCSFQSIKSKLSMLFALHYLYFFCHTLFRANSSAKTSEKMLRN